MQVEKFRENNEKGNDGFSLGLSKIENFRQQRDVLARKFDIAKFSLEDSERRAKKALDMHQDAGLDLSLV